MSILVFGSRGQVGRELMLRSSGTVSVHGCCRPEFDITSPSSIDRALDRSWPRVVVNAAAYTAVDKAEQEGDLAFAVNAEGAANLARACAARGIAMIHLSTDYVFDGEKTGAYVEDDPVNPVNQYGRSKEAGERLVREILPDHVLLRTAWVYSPFGNNFMTAILRLGAERAELGVVADQFGNPTSARSIADVVLVIATDLARQRRDGFGTFHYVDSGDTTWYGFASEIFRLAAAYGMKVPKLKAITTADYPTAARRPRNSTLNCGRLLATYGRKQTPWQEALACCFDAFHNGMAK